MVWHAQLDMRYRLEAGRTVARHRHTGPLRVLQSLYPEGDAVCHNVLVHPPGGLVGGDTLTLNVSAEGGSHGLLTTPGATRFYRSEGAWAHQQTHLRLDAGARLEWIPQEAICYDGCQAHNQLTLDLAPEAQCLAWDVTALGLPAAQLPFNRGELLQDIRLPGIWVERGHLRADDQRLLLSPAGLDGMRCMASLVWASGSTLSRTHKESLLESARACWIDHPLAYRAGATSPHPQVVVVRVLADQVEPAMQLLRKIRSAWRDLMWATQGSEPRIWAM
jgi:urease accessory protein